MNRDLTIDLMNAWDALDNAARRILVAQPAAMTSSAENLDEARKAMQEVMSRIIRAAAAHGQSAINKQEEA